MLFLGKLQQDWHSFVIKSEFTVCFGMEIRCGFVMTGIPAFPGVDLAGNSIIYYHAVTLAFCVNLNELECESASFDFRINKPTLYYYCGLCSCLLFTWIARQLLAFLRLLSRITVAFPFNFVMQEADESLSSSSFFIALN